MISKLFHFVAQLLVKLASLTGRTYNEINIIVYYVIIPFSYLLLIDAILNVHYLSIAFLIFCLGFFVGCPNFKSFSDDLFMKSVRFLNYFNRFGSNYIASSVWICVVFPIALYGILIFLAMK